MTRSLKTTLCTSLTPTSYRSVLTSATMLAPQCQHAWYFADEAIEAEQIEGFGTLSHIREIAAYQFMGPMPAEVERLKTLNSCLPGLKFP